MPATTKLTVEPDTVHTLLVAEENVTGLPDAPPMAATAYGGPPATAVVGARELKTIAWDPRATV